MSRYFFENSFHACKVNTSTDKVHFKNLHILAVTYDMGVLSLSFRRCLSGCVFFPLFVQFLETEMTWSQSIIVRECIFTNQNLCFAPR